MKKRILSLFLALVMCSSLCVFASAADSMDSATSPVNVNGTACEIWSTIFENKSQYRAGTWIKTNNNSNLSAGRVKIQSYLYDSTGRLDKSSESILQSDYYFHVAYTKFKAAADYALAGGSVWVKNSSGRWIQHDTEETPSYNISRSTLTASLAGTLENGKYPRNNSDMSYGSLAVSDVAGETPELISAMGTNGEGGYIKKADLLEEYDADKYEGYACRFIPLYDVEENEIGTFKVYFNDPSEISGMDVDEARAKLTDGRSEDPILWDLADKTLVDGTYPTNKNGETYGHPLLKNLVGHLPDLIESTNGDGIHGYTRESDEPVMSVTANDVAESSQPLYDKDGNVIGTFQFGGNDSVKTVGKTISEVTADLGATELEQEEQLEQAKRFAYLDVNEASPELKEKILEARKEIIYNTDWVADGYTGYIQDVETGEIIKELPQFSEVFPEWDIPVEKIAPVDESRTRAIPENDSKDLVPLESAMGLDDWIRVVTKRHYLEAASATENANPFTIFDVDPYEIGTHIRAYASALSSSASCNIGISDYDSGESLGLGTRLAENYAVVVFVGTTEPTVAVRASTYSTPGWATMAVDGAYRVGNTI